MQPRRGNCAGQVFCQTSNAGSSLILAKLAVDERYTNTEPGADRGLRAGSPRGVAVAIRSVIKPSPGRYRSRLRICES